MVKPSPPRLWPQSVTESPVTLPPDFGRGTEKCPSRPTKNARYSGKAIKKAEQLVDGHDVELWNGARLVIVLQHTSNEVRAFERQIDQSQRMSKDAKDDAASARIDKLTI
jgi:hypothetical protein